MRVEELSQFGKPFTGLEKEAVKAQERIFMASEKVELSDEKRGDANVLGMGKSLVNE